jgi:hypothetical protein
MELIKEARRFQKLAGILVEAIEPPKPEEETPEETPKQAPEQAPTPETPSGTISRDEAKKLIQATKGKFLTVTFTKKDGTTRVMNCRLGVKAYLKGGTLPYNPNEFNLIPVWDPQAHRTTGNGYRMISANTITALKIGANEYKVQ